VTARWDDTEYRSSSSLAKHSTMHIHTYNYYNYYYYYYYYYNMSTVRVR